MPCSGARAPRSLGTHPPKKVPTFADYLVFGGAAVDGAPGTFPQVILTRHADPTTVLGLEHFRATARRRGLGAFVCDGIDRETVEGRNACQDHLRECSRRASL